MNKLPSGKAVGVDALADTQLKTILKENPSIRKKLLTEFESWINGDSAIPEYLKVAKTFFLSKEETPFPELGLVRSISILPASLKLWEQILHAKLRSEINEKAPLHENQRGFVPGGSCLQNISEAINLIENIRTNPMSRGRKAPPKEFLFFLDLKKAIDTIDRALLLDTMDKKGINRKLIAATRNLYNGMKMRINGEDVVTNVGVVQGGVTSPLLFNLSIDDMIRELNKFGKCLALADDIVIHVRGELKLNMMLKKLEQLCSQLGL